MTTGQHPNHSKTFTEQARRTQLIGIAHELIADRGYRGTSLQAIADAAGVTKAAVLYYFPSKAAVIQAAYDEVVMAVADDILAAVDAVPPAQAPSAYVRAMIGHLNEHPQHVRIFAEAALDDSRPYSRRERWQPLATLIENAADHDEVEVRDARMLAIIVGGAIDGIIAEKLDDPTFDGIQAAEELIAMLPHGDAGPHTPREAV